MGVPEHSSRCRPSCLEPSGLNPLGPEGTQKSQDSGWGFSKGRSPTQWHLRCQISAFQGWGLDVAASMRRGHRPKLGGLLGGGVDMGLREIVQVAKASSERHNAQTKN